MQNEKTIFRSKGIYGFKNGYEEIEDCDLVIQVAVSDGVDAILNGNWEQSQQQMAKILGDLEDNK